MEKPFMQVMQDRYAVRAVNPEMKIEDATLSQILEVGRLSPSSYGLEPTRFLVIRDQATKEKLQAACFDQAQIATCSDVVVLLTVNQFNGVTDYVKNQFTRWGMDDDSFNAVVEFYKMYTSRYNEQTLPHWAGKQSYIALGNMMTAAQNFGIGSCPVEGFEEEAVYQALDIDKEKYSLQVIAAFGEPADQARPKHRLALEELVTYI